MQAPNRPIAKEVVLLGGGHAHVAVLKNFGMEPLPGVRVTLISQDVYTPYSGMLPGFLAGHYRSDEIQVDLRRLCQFAGAQFYRGSVSGLDLKRRRVLCSDRPPVGFDLLSINTGSTPETAAVPGAAEHGLRVKPIDQFLRGWEILLERIDRPETTSLRVVVVGGGAGGVELALATRHRLQQRLLERNAGGVPLDYTLVTASSTILPTHNRQVQKKFERILRTRHIQVRPGKRARQVEPGRLLLDDNSTIEFDALFWLTDAAAPLWAKAAGWRTDERGFIAVDQTLRSVSHPFVFAAGDVAAMEQHARPKSGVFAVRQGPILASNLRRALQDQPLQRFAPQHQFLNLISTGDKYAVASRGPWAWEGNWVWRWKDWIDRRWMRRYQELPAMTEDQNGPSAALPLPDAGITAPTGGGTMRCGGCGAKVGSLLLTRVLQRLEPVAREDVLVGLNAPDDAAVTTVPAGKLSVQTVDFFRSFLSDPFIFGQVAAEHSLNDIFAMGAEPQSALAIVTLPFGAEARVEEQLFQVLSGACAVLAAHRTALAGGHTSEGAELAFGLVVNGVVDPGRLWRKAGLRPNDRLVLTKPLGTGTLFAAAQRGKAEGRWIEAALTQMLCSNEEAARCLREHGATACTDVSGFGLLGHLRELTTASGVGATLFLEQLPVLDGALPSMRAGLFSSLHPENRRLLPALANDHDAEKLERYPLLFDPQTSGGLLAGVPAEQAAACIAQLKKRGYAHAAIIGQVSDLENPAQPIVIRSAGSDRAEGVPISQA